MQKKHAAFLLFGLVVCQSFYHVGGGREELDRGMKGVGIVEEQVVFSSTAPKTNMTKWKIRFF